MVACAGVCSVGQAEPCNARSILAYVVDRWLDTTPAVTKGVLKLRINTGSSSALHKMRSASLEGRKRRIDRLEEAEQGA